MNEATTPMEGGGVYNTFGVFQNGAHAVTYPSLQKMVERIISRFRAETNLVVTDLGCSEGRNSLPTIHLVIQALRTGVAHAQILVFHNDLPSNDFNSLMEMLGGPGKYCEPGDPMVHSFALGRSFYHPLFPPGYVHLHLSYITLHWLSRTPVPLPGSRIFSWGLDANGSDKSVAQAWESQAKDDLQTFLALRSAELTVGGEMCIVMVGGGASCFVEAPPGRELPVISVVLEQLIGEGLLTTADVERIVVPYHLRHEKEVREAVATTAQGVLQVTACATHFVSVIGEGAVLETPEQLDGVVGLFWAIHGPTLQKGLVHAGNEVAMVADQVMVRAK
uniref:Uncharacterized protein n=1 Tax=Eutreptiella gymnastica TaxID=73025 RepID=A0A7S1IMQ4_9EUGL|mmetsp:Transcript_29839/g.53668  ORF Transcript_29839/g.53668 Transcript_29839/m.53668 type:complete len:334 (+) Transcript_29839:86-1087(+)